jgi:hypothetical protein
VGATVVFMALVVAALLPSAPPLVSRPGSLGIPIADEPGHGLHPSVATTDVSSTPVVSYESTHSAAGPLPLTLAGDFAQFDVQAHCRGSGASCDIMQAGHGADCSAPPATHPISQLMDSVFICNGHVMTAINASGYGMVALTPTQLLDCTVSCSVTWEMSTERMSLRDWPDLWITPWADNLTLPFDMGDVDLQGEPKTTLHIDGANSQNTFVLKGSVNGKHFQDTQPWSSPPMNQGIARGTNQAATRQTFRFSMSPNRMRLERLASSTASLLVFWDIAMTDVDTAPFRRNDLVVQFAHHSYSPTKEDSCGDVCQPGTWHWDKISLAPARPFTLIRGPRVSMGGTVMFGTPAPADSFLRFTAICKVSIDGKPVNRQRFLGKPEHASSYFVPIPEGKQSVTVSFASEGSCGAGMARDFAIWAR